MWTTFNLSCSQRNATQNLMRNPVKRERERERIDVFPCNPPTSSPDPKERNRHTNKHLYNGVWQGRVPSMEVSGDTVKTGLWRGRCLGWVWHEELVPIDAVFWRRGRPKWHSSRTESLVYSGHLVNTFSLNRLRKDTLCQEAKAQSTDEQCVNWTNVCVSERAKSVRELLMCPWKIT